MFGASSIALLRRKSRLFQQMLRQLFRRQKSPTLSSLKKLSYKGTRHAIEEFASGTIDEDFVSIVRGEFLLWIHRLLTTRTALAISLDARLPCIRSLR
jgi:hypothetical protein